MNDLDAESISLGILASHGGSNLQAIMDACDNGSLKANVAVVVSNNSGSLAMRRARKSGIPAYHLSSSTHSDDGDLDVAIKNIFLYEKPLYCIKTSCTTTNNC